MKVFDITITGGEPMVAPTFGDLISVFRDTTFSSTQVITNGTMLSKPMATRLAESGLTRISISIDSRGQGHDLARGKGTLQRAWRGLENALEAGLMVNVISVIGMHNIDEWDQLPTVLRAMGVRSHNASLMCRLGRAEKSDIWMGVPQSRVSEVQQAASTLENDLNCAEFFFHLNDGVARPPGWSGKPTPLHAFQDRNPGIEIVADVAGSLLRNRIYGKDRRLGNLEDDRLADIWRNDAYNREQIENIVGVDSIGRLADKYYHYSSFDASDSPPIKVEDPIDSHRFRTRYESWGEAVFDTETFAIVKLSGNAQHD
jgi:MoaA/NifB/PqqE/SkfB family radical SAM enzyme